VNEAALTTHAGQGPVTAADLAERARALVPGLRDRAREAEMLRRLPDETVRELERAGLCKVWIPKRYGGLELDLHAGLATMQALARGCASTAWCLSVYQQHSWIVAHFPEAAQEETLGADPDFHIGAVLAPRGKARKTDGGYIVDGVWPFGSGCEHGRWVALGALVVDDDGREIPLGREVYGVPALNARLCLIPLNEVEVLGDWDVAGLSATGSHSIAARQVFVPEHRTLLIADAVEGKSPGMAIHDGSLFRAAYYAFLVTALGGLAPGIAQGALDALMAGMDKRVVMPMNRIQGDMVRSHRQIAEAMTKIRMSELALKDSADRIMEAAQAGRPLSVAERAQCRLDTAMAVHHAYEATEIVFFAAGGSTLNLKHPIQRAMRDAHAMKAHYFMDLDTALELRGMIALGRTPFTYIF
jgi:3-hydroxy-9,10-secoandrosta-1,3,5(10)-triene-9,17-dione monooxygenase